MLRTVSVNGPTNLNALRNLRMTCYSEEILEGIPLFTNTDIASDSLIVARIPSCLGLMILYGYLHLV